jgi:4-amino-4-deoxy-L-arabinose transferase-like glycosyltransferase
MLLVEKASGAVSAPLGRSGHLSPNAAFWLAVAACTGVGAVVRFTYLFHGAPSFIFTDGYFYHVEAVGLADGLGYTVPMGAGRVEWAHHPPAWATLLAGVAEAGWRSLRDAQAVGMLIGLGVILVAGLVGRRYGGRRVGVLAAAFAALYPGFWVLEGQVVSEPLGLLVSGVLVLVLADLWEHPTLARAVLAGAAVGLLALVRSEQVFLLVLAVLPLLLLNRRLAMRRRLTWACAAIATTVAMLAPWTAYNASRFEAPVVLSTNLGFTLLAGNCPPFTYSGDRMGSYQLGCVAVGDKGLAELDAAQRDSAFRRYALAHMRDNLGRLPATIAARHGRMLGVFRPSQTVGISATWALIPTWPVWAWVASFWVIAPLAACGSVLLWRSRRFQWPLVAPLVIVLLAVTVTYGEPRYHTMADLGLLVLAAVAVDRVLRRVGAARRSRTVTAPGAGTHPG